MAAFSTQLRFASDGRLRSPVFLSSMNVYLSRIPIKIGLSGHETLLTVAPEPDHLISDIGSIFLKAETVWLHVARLAGLLGAQGYPALSSRTFLQNPCAAAAQRVSDLSVPRASNAVGGQNQQRDEGNHRWYRPPDHH